MAERLPHIVVNGGFGDRLVFLDGALVGGASLNADQFSDILQAARP